jgi:hypothetical protein
MQEQKRLKDKEERVRYRKRERGKSCLVGSKSFIFKLFPLGESKSVAANGSLQMKFSAPFDAFISPLSDIRMLASLSG